MSAHFYCHTSLAQMEDWHRQLMRQLSVAQQTIIFDSGNVPLLVVTPLNANRPVALVINEPLGFGPALDEQVADEMTARCQVENTQVPRQWAYLRYLWARP